MGNLGFLRVRNGVVGAVLGLALATSAATGVVSGTTTRAVAPDSGADRLPAGERARVAAALANESSEHLVATPATAAGPGVRSVGDLEVPEAAIRAYQLAAATLAQVQPSCGLEWTLLAALGKVESDHGRADGARLDDDGRSHPMIRGAALDGSGPLPRIRDTDGGSLDGDPRWDRAMGAMQLLPAAWAVVGVDGDGDGRRSPDDLDDAALGAAVYLCAVPGNLETTAGKAEAVRAYNPDPSFVFAVLQLDGVYQASTLALETSSILALGAVDLGESLPAAPETKRQPQQPGTEETTGPSAEPTTGSTARPTTVPDPGDPAPDDPTPSTAPPGEPTPSTTPSPSPGTTTPAAPSPSATPEPLVVELTGVLQQLDGAWVLETTDDAGQPTVLALDVGDETWLATAALADLDADGTVETNGAELAGLAGTEVIVLVAVPATGTDVHVLIGVNEAEYRPADPA